MSYRKAKTAPKIFQVDREFIKAKILNTMYKISEAVGRTLGPGGENLLLESDYPGLPNKNTKDGVTVFKSLGAIDPYEHLIIEQARDAATRTATEAGDGTTTATVLAYNIIHNLFDFCQKNPKYSPQKATRRIAKVVNDLLLPYIETRAIKVGIDNKVLLKNVATISANGDSEMADAVIQAFEEIGYGDSSHVTIRELSGKKNYVVERIDGFPIPMGFEESIGKMHTAFINDQANQRCYLEKPLFLLYDGNMNDLVMALPLLQSLGDKYVTEGNSDYKNLVIFAHGFSENVLTSLAFNFSNPNTMNVLPMITPMAQFMNSQTHFLHDLAAFTGAKVFGMKDQISSAQSADLGSGMESFEAYRFRCTVIGNPDPVNVEVRAEDLKVMKKNAESEAERFILEERIGKITNGIAKLTIYGGSNGELKEAHDRCEDAVCAVRSAISHGAVPGGCRLAIDMALLLAGKIEEGDPAREVLMPSLLALPSKLLDNAGYNTEEISETIGHLVRNEDLVYDVENQLFGKAEELGLFDATKAVSESLSNAVSIASILGTCGGLVCYPRDDVFERSEAKADSEYMKTVENPNQFVNESNERH
jgi:chaperonin GroEL